MLLQQRVPDLGDPGAPVALPDAAELLLRRHHASAAASSLQARPASPADSLPGEGRTEQAGRAQQAAERWEPGEHWALSSSQSVCEYKVREVPAYKVSASGSGVWGGE